MAVKSASDKDLIGGAILNNSSVKNVQKNVSSSISSNSPLSASSLLRDIANSEILYQVNKVAGLDPNRPADTQAATSEAYLKSVGNSVKPVVSGAASALSNLAQSASNSSQSSGGSVAVVPSGGGTSVAIPNYLHADLAKAYGMDATTAYQEALSNTAYQRSVADLQAAGLNPVIAAGAQPAGGVYGATLASNGVAVNSGVSSAKSAHNWYKMLKSGGTLIGSMIGLMTGKNPYTAVVGGTLGGTIGGSIGNMFDQL